MLSSPHRLAKDRDIKRVLVRGRSFFSPLFRIRLLANGTGPSRFAIVVSSKVSKKATVRNTVRRRLTEIIRLNLAAIKPGYDVMVTVSNRALPAGYHKLETQLLTCFDKAKIVMTNHQAPMTK